MKVNVEVTCTPEEARAFFGLPDLKPMQDRIMGEIEERLKTSLNSMNPEGLVPRVVAALTLAPVLSDELARKTFRFSLIHLSLLFAALLIDHYLPWKL